MSELDQYLEIRDRYSKYMKASIASNEWLYDPLFFTMASQMLRVRGRIGAKDGRVRIHSIFIQPSRTGKGHAISTMTKLVEAFNAFCKKEKVPDRQVKIHITSLEPTVQLLVGDVIKDPTFEVWQDSQLETGFQTVTEKDFKKAQQAGKKVKMSYTSRIKPGLLGRYDLIAWAEAKAMLTPKAIYGDLDVALLNTMDDAGLVTFPTRSQSAEDGTVLQYTTTSSLVAGTAMYEGMEKAIFDLGLLPRFLMSFKPITVNEHLELTKGIFALDRTVTGEDAEDVRFSLRWTLAEALFDRSSERIMDNTEWNLPRVVTKTMINPETREPLFVEELDESSLLPQVQMDVYKANNDVLDHYMDKKLALFDKYSDVYPSGEGLNSFMAYWHASSIYDAKIASLVARMSNLKEITEPCFDEAMRVTSLHLDSAIGLLSTLYLPPESKTEDKRRQIVRRLFLSSTTVELSEAVNSLTSKNLTKHWEYGKRRTQDYLHGLVKEGVLEVENGPRGKKILYLAGTMPENSGTEAKKAI